MNEITLDEFLESLNVNIPALKDFEKLADMTGLFQNPLNQEWIKLNYERGLLLYGIISKYKPKNVLEFGTAKGYATLCMAWAMDDNDIDGKIFTIDPLSLDEKKEHTIKDPFKNEIISKNISVKGLWKKIAKQTWIDKITPLCGYSGEIMQKQLLPKIDFAYIDGAHFFRGVQHDFYSLIEHLNPNFSILFDDYIDRPQYGIKQLIDNELSPHFDIKLIKTDTKNYLKKIFNLSDSLYGMCFLDSTSLQTSIHEIFPRNEREKIISEYLKFENRLKRRYSINKKLPFLKNMKFQFWK